MNNREYLVELVTTEMDRYSGMPLWHRLRTIITSNANKKNGLESSSLNYIKAVMDRVRRKNNREVYLLDSALQYQHWVTMTDGHGWQKIRGITKRDNVPGEWTE